MNKTSAQIKHKKKHKIIQVGKVKPLKKKSGNPNLEKKTSGQEQSTTRKNENKLY